MRRRVLARVLVVGLITTSAGMADEWSKRFPYVGITDLRIDTNDAAVTVHAWERNEIEARVLTQGYKIPDDVLIRERQVANKLELQVKVGQLNFGVGRRSVRIELLIPAGLNSVIRTDDGSISVTGVKGTLQLTSGDGAIETAEVDGSLQAVTKDGEIHVRGRFDALNVQTGDGSIQVDAARGSSIRKDWRVRTGDGGVKLRLPDGFAADVDAQTTDGSITSRMPVATTTASREHQLRGKLNGGGPPLIIRTGGGSIRLDRF